MVEGATGHMEGEEERLVKTPWFDYEIPFTKAAAIGTKKVITEHSTIGVVVTCDGSFGEIAAKQYEPAEEETIKQLKALKKAICCFIKYDSSIFRKHKAASG